MSDPPLGGVPVEQRPAVKLLAQQALAATSTGSDFLYRGVSFSKFWLQGTVIESAPDGSELLLDDGSAVIMLRFQTVGATSARAQLTALVTDTGSAKGRYFMFVGKLAAGGATVRHMKVHKFAELLEPNREARWGVEVAELWRDVLAQR